MKMKHPAAWATGMLAAVLLCSAAKVQTTTIKGTINPPNGASQVWALSSSDTLKANVSNGTFEFKDAKPGVYSLKVEAIAPYKSASKEGVQVADGATVDVGEIKLEK